MMISHRIGSSLAALGLAAVATLGLATPARAESATLGCVIQSTVDYAPNLSSTTSTKHVIGTGTLTNCTGGVDATFRLNGDGPANCFGHSFMLYLDIFWANGEYSFAELYAPALLQIGVYAGKVLDYAHKDSKVGIAAVPGGPFLLNCLRPGGVHVVSSVGLFGLSA
jgi:hypothetical protein